MGKRVLYILCVLLLLSSCEERNGAFVVTNSHLVEFNSTRVIDSDGRTYKVYLQGISGTVTEGREFSGTYYDPVGGEKLIPCDVSDGGVWIRDNDAAGLRAINGPYKMFIVSPAKSMTSIAQTTLYGYPYERNSEGVYVSNLKDVEVSGVYMTGSNGSAVVYDAENDPLQQPRSKMSVIFACGDDIESTTLHSILLCNVIDRGYYIPSEARFHYEDSDLNTIDFYNGDPITISSKQERVLNQTQYLLSMDYGQKDNDGNTIWPLPSLQINIGDSGSVSFTAGLGLNFEPQHSYVLKITINSNYINFSVAVSKWNSGGDNSSSVDGVETWTINMPFEDNLDNNLFDWEKVDNLTGVI